jgi:hypothetical protein
MAAASFDAFQRNRVSAFASGTGIGTLAWLIGLGGAGFRLPFLIGMFRFGGLDAVIIHKAMSLVVAATALLFRTGTGLPHPSRARLSHIEEHLEKELVVPCSPFELGAGRLVVAGRKRVGQRHARPGTPRRHRHRRHVDLALLAGSTPCLAVERHHAIDSHRVGERLRERCRGSVSRSSAPGSFAATLPSRARTARCRCSIWRRTASPAETPPRRPGLSHVTFFAFPRRPGLSHVALLVVSTRAG